MTTRPTFFIPAKGTSQRIPTKNLQRLTEEYTLLTWTLAGDTVLDLAPRSCSDSKMTMVDELVLRVEAYRRLGQSIVFTNGCFEMMDVGLLSSTMIYPIDYSSNFAPMSWPKRERPPKLSAAKSSRIMAGQFFRLEGCEGVSTTRLVTAIRSRTASTNTADHIESESEYA